VRQKYYPDSNAAIGDGGGAAGKMPALRWEAWEIKGGAHGSLAEMGSVL